MLPVLTGSSLTIGTGRWTLRCPSRAAFELNTMSHSSHGKEHKTGQCFFRWMLKTRASLKTRGAFVIASMQTQVKSVSRSSACRRLLPVVGGGEGIVVRRVWCWVGVCIEGTIYIRNGGYNCQKEKEKVSRHHWLASCMDACARWAGARRRCGHLIGRPCWRRACVAK